MLKIQPQVFLKQTYSYFWKTFRRGLIKFQVLSLNRQEKLRDFKKFTEKFLDCRIFKARIKCVPNNWMEKFWVDLHYIVCEIKCYFCCHFPTYSRSQCAFCLCWLAFCLNHCIIFVNSFKSCNLCSQMKNKLPRDGKLLYIMMSPVSLCRCTDVFADVQSLQL